MNLAARIKAHEEKMLKEVEERREQMRKEEEAGETCFKCGSDRVASIQGKSSDLSDFGYQGWEHSGYLPYVDNICGGDYIEFSVCLECGQVQGNFPVSDEGINEKRKEEEEDEDWDDEDDD